MQPDCKWKAGAAGAISALIFGAGVAWAAGDSRAILLPEETAVLRPSPLEGYKIAEVKCRICHSADYVNLQPPGMTLAQWTAEMVKMQRAYGAPLDEAEIKLLAIYLATIYGDATSAVPAEPVKPPPGS